MWLWVVLSIIGLLVVFFALMGHLGRRLPEEHVAALTLRLNQPPQAVWDVISDMAGHKHWSRGVTDMIRMPDHDNREVWKQHMGRNVFLLETTASYPPTRLVGTITDTAGYFSGNWEYEITPEDAGSRVRLTEHGRVPSAIPRAMMHYLFGETMYLRRHLVSLAKKFDERPRVEEIAPFGVDANERTEHV